RRPVPGAGGDLPRAQLDGRGRLRRLGLARAVPALGRPARNLAVDTPAPRRISAVPQDAGRGPRFARAAVGSVLPMEELEADPHRAVCADDGPGRRLV